MVPDCTSTAAARARFAGTLWIPASIHERKHMVMINTDEDTECRVLVNSRPVALLTRSDGVDVAGVPQKSTAIWYREGSESFRVDHHDSTSMKSEDLTAPIDKY